MKSMDMVHQVVAVLMALALMGCGRAVPSGGSGAQGGSSPTDTQVNERYEVTHDDVVTDPETGDSYVSGMLLVYFDPQATQQMRDDAVALVKGEVVGCMDAFDEYQVRVDAADEAALEELRAMLEGAAGVDVVSLDRVSLLTDATPNDPWDGPGLGGSDASWWTEAVGAPAAWECYDNPGLESVRVAVVDNGFDMSHEDLASRVSRVSGADSANRNVRDHGTHVAAILGAQADNGRGIAGMVWRGDVLCYDASPSIDPVQPDVLPDSCLEQALLESVRAGAKVINFSNGSSGAKTWGEWAQDQSKVDTCGRVYSRRVGALLAEGHDFVVVQSAGNGDSSGRGIDATYNLEFASITSANCDSSYAAASEILDRVIVVAAAERAGGGYQLTSFSNGGPQVDVCAPGQAIYSAVAGGYASKNGTSMAAPIVSGVVGLVWAANPGLSGREVKQLVCMSATTSAAAYPGAQYSGGTYPLVNAETAVYDALALANQGVEPPVEESGEGALAAFERYLRDIYNEGTPQGDGVALAADGGDTDYYRSFAIGDFDNDGTPELLVAHEMMGSAGNSFGCLNDVYEYVPGAPAGSDVVLARRAITSFEPDSVSWPGTGWLCLYGGSGSDGSGTRVYMPVSDARAQEYALPDTSYLSTERIGDSWHLLTCSAYSVDADQALDDAQYGQVAAELEGATPSPVPLQPIFDEAIEAVDAGA